MPFMTSCYLLRILGWALPFDCWSLFSLHFHNTFRLSYRVPAWLDLSIIWFREFVASLSIELISLSLDRSSFTAWSVGQSFLGLQFFTAVHGILLNFRSALLLSPIALWAYAHFRYYTAPILPLGVSIGMFLPWRCFYHPFLYVEFVRRWAYSLGFLHKNYL